MTTLRTIVSFRGAAAFARPALCRSTLLRGGALRMQAVRSFSTPSALDSEDSKALYALGFNIGTQLSDLKALSSEELDTLLGGMRACVLGETSAVPLAEFMPKAQALVQGKSDAAAEKNGAVADTEGVAALAKAAAETGAQQTKTGLVYFELAGGDGATPTYSDKVRVHYEGTLVDGTVFDSSRARGEPIEFPLSGVIAGWTEGLQLMKTGGRARLTIPSAIAYGDKGTPGGPIPPKATLVFDVELLAIV